MWLVCCGVFKSLGLAFVLRDKNLLEDKRHRGESSRSNLECSQSVPC